VLYRLHELAFRTQYAELKERAQGSGPLLPGTPGTLYERRGTGNAYWYRVYYSAPGVQAEAFVAPAQDHEAVSAMRDRVAFAQWMATQVADLRKLGFQVGDKGVARVLVELHNAGAFAAGLVVVGTLGFMAWLNELGARTVAAATQDIDVARRQALRLATPLRWLETVQATRLPFTPVPGLPSTAPSTSLKLPGRDGLRIDLLAPGRSLGVTVAVPELGWHAQGVPHYEWLLDAPAAAAILAGGQCVPVRLPRVEPLVWHKLYASASRPAGDAKAAKDLLQAATLAAIGIEEHDLDLGPSWRDAPGALRSAARKRLPALRRALAEHPQTLETLETMLTE
jgi:hypothetical protein